MSHSKAQRIDMTIDQKVEVIKIQEKDPKIGVRKLAELFQCGKTQIATTLKNKDSILKVYYENPALERKRYRTSEFADINEAVHDWYLIVVSKGIYPNGAHVQEKAKIIAERLGHVNFVASNGWLDRWKKRYNIKGKVVSGESAGVSEETVVSWKERLPEILEGFQPKDIWNLDETGCFWRALPNKGLCQQSKACKGGKKAKERITVVLICNALGEKERAIVIWRAEKPRCFHSVKKEELPVDYFCQKKAWMTGEILDTVLLHMTRRLQAKSRFVILLMDNAGCHPADLKEKYSNIKIVFFPPNTTSVLQPLDLGIIQSFKLHYKKFLMTFVLSKIDECSSASDVTKSVTVLHAIPWVAQAWQNVKDQTILKCFRAASVLNDDFEVASIPETQEDPFADLDNREEELQGMLSQLPETCLVEEYLSAEKDLPTGPCYDEESWEEDFFDEVGHMQKSKKQKENEHEQEDSDSDKDIEEICTSVPKICTLSEAMSSLEDIQQFLDHQG